MEGREKKDEKTLNKIPRIDAEYMEKYILSTIKMINILKYHENDMRDDDWLCLQHVDLWNSMNCRLCCILA